MRNNVTSLSEPELREFVKSLTVNAKYYSEWLPLVQFGLNTLLENQRLFIEILLIEADRDTPTNDAEKAARLLQIMKDLNLQFTVIEKEEI